MSSNLRLKSANRDVLVSAGASGDKLHRLSNFANWLDATGGVWFAPDLAAYRDYLLYHRRDGNGNLKILAASSVRVHISTIRAHYDKLLHQVGLRDKLYAATPPDGSPADKKALVDEAIVRIENAIHPQNAKVEVTEKQDIEDSAELRLTARQAAALANKPPVDNLLGLRDRAMIALALALGLREFELVALTVEDLRQAKDGELACRVRHGKGDKQRLIPYGEMSAALVLVDAWLETASIGSGYVFRGFRKDGKTIRSGKLTTRTFERVLQNYPVAISGVLRYVKPHDLRRTYAALNYAAGMDVVAIQQNLGHADLKTTLCYIGDLNFEKRRTRNIFEIDITELTAALAALRQAG